MSSAGDPTSPPEPWALRYHDLFDTECAPSREEEGVGLASGLCALWRLHLTQGTVADGGPSFSSFELRLASGRFSINHLTLHRRGVALLRAWSGDPDRLHLLARAHSALHDPRRPTAASDEIFRLAAEAADHGDAEARLRACLTRQPPSAPPR